MAIAYVAGTTASTSGLGSINVSWPTTHAAGELGLLIVETANENVPSDPSGWTRIVNVKTSTLTPPNGTALTVWWRIATSSAMGSATVPDSGDHQVGRIWTFSGTDQTNPISVVETATSETPGTALSWPNATTLTNNEMVVLIVSSAADGGNAISGLTSPTLSGFAVRTQTSATSGNGGAFNTAHGIKATPGAIGVHTATQTLAAENTYAVITLKEPSAVSASQFKVRSGGAWVLADAKVRSGGAWVAATPKIRQTSSWS